MSPVEQYTIDCEYLAYFKPPQYNDFDPGHHSQGSSKKFCGGLFLMKHNLRFGLVWAVCTVHEHIVVKNYFEKYFRIKRQKSCHN